MDDLSAVVLEDIRRHAHLAAADKERYVEYLMGLSEQGRSGELEAWRKESAQCLRRLDELDAILRRLYEDDVFGRISPERYASMSAVYEREFEQVKSRNAELQDMISAYRKQSKSSGEFAELVARYTDITELTAELLNTLIERIVIHEREIVDGKPFMRVDIHYRFIGSVGDASGDGLKSRTTKVTAKSYQYKER